MPARISLGKFDAQVIQKNIKNVHLSVHPPEGRVTIAAPLRMDLDTIRVFALSKLGWIKQQRKKIQAQDRETRREYLNRESHYLWGKRYLLKLIEKEAAPQIDLRHTHMILQARPGADKQKLQTILDDWYRAQLRTKADVIIAQWQPILKVTVNRLFIQRMKTKWGSCNHKSANIRLNTDLARKPPECLEYIVVHEMVHLFEPTHNKRFIAAMDHFLPAWRHHRQVLNRLPLRHETWEY